MTQPRSTTAPKKSQTNVKRASKLALVNGEIRQPSDSQVRKRNANSCNCEKISTCTKRSSPGSSAGDIRGRFLNRLGIQKEPSPTSTTPEETTSNAKMVPAPRSERLKISSSDDDTGASSLCSSSFGSSIFSLRSTKSRSVSFDQSVSVRTIPRRDAYTDRIKDQLWCSAQELHENAVRNSYEFAAENWDWRQAVEEEHMVMIGSDHIHPVHCSRECSIQRNFLLVMAARQAQR